MITNSTQGNIKDIFFGCYCEYIKARFKYAQGFISKN